MRLHVRCVLRTGGDFDASHVYLLKRQCVQHMGLPYRAITTPDDSTLTWDFGVLSDRAHAFDFAGIPFKHAWPGWWSKLEVCRPDIRGTVLYMDLDTVLVGELAPLLDDLTTSAVLRDFYRGRTRPGSVQSSFMLLTETDRAAVWEEFTADPSFWMAQAGGDQLVFEKVLSGRVRVWQDEFPGAFVSYKGTIRRQRMTHPPDDCRVVIFHGNPRPWSEDAPRWARRLAW